MGEACYSVANVTAEGVGALPYSFKLQAHHRFLLEANQQI